VIRIHANLDCEATWAGVQLPARVLRKISALAALTSVLADDDAEVWAPAAVDPTRLLAAPAWHRPAMRVGVPEAPDLAWARPDAKPYNDRRFALDVAEVAGIDMAGARVITSIDELAGATGPWVCKALWTTAGRDRCHGDGPPTAEQRVYLARMLERARIADQLDPARPPSSSQRGLARRSPTKRAYAEAGGVCFEPWLDRLVDAGTCARVDATGVIVDEPHTLIVDPRGGFGGIELTPPALAASERDDIVAAVHSVGTALAAAGYVGPFAVDSFVYMANGERRLRPLVEVNARHSFGHVARALGARRLGFAAPPVDATVLVAPTIDDPTTAWIA
jgi:hypothetical protein